MSERHPRAWLGGVCAELSQRLNFSRFGLRVVTVVCAMIWPLLTIGSYLIGAFALSHQSKPTESDPYLKDWDRRMDDFDRRFGG